MTRKELEKEIKKISKEYNIYHSYSDEISFIFKDRSIPIEFLLERTGTVIITIYNKTNPQDPPICKAYVDYIEVNKDYKKLYGLIDIGLAYPKTAFEFPLE